jgi:hypothetical protein
MELFCNPNKKAPVATGLLLTDQAMHAQPEHLFALYAPRAVWSILAARFLFYQFAFCLQ